MLLRRLLRQEKELLPTLAGLLLHTVSISATAGEFDCRDVDPAQTGHNKVHQELVDRVGIAPAEFAYCAHDSYPRWRARWNPTEIEQHQGQTWPRYLTARCWDDQAGLSCRITNHVVLGSSHVVVDIKSCDVSTDAIAGISQSVDAQYPKHEMKEIEHSEVQDGGAWSSSDYGYNVTLIEPPKYDGGILVRFVNQCEADTCQWAGLEQNGTWIGGTTDLPKLRREHGDPLIEIMHP